MPEPSKPSAESPTWPERSALCLDCRTALRDGEPCDIDGAHRVRSLRAAEPREDYLSAVWGPPSTRQRIKQYGKAGATGGGFGGGLEACGSIGDAGLASGELGPIAAVLLVAAIAAGLAILLAWLISAIARRIRLARNRPRPNGAPHRPRPTKAKQVVRGVVANDISSALAPLRRTACAAFYLELRDRRARSSGIILRDGATGGFTVRTDAGDEVRVPAGRIRMWNLSDWRASTPERLDDYLSDLDDRRAGCSDLELFPHDRAREATVLLGDRIELIATFERVPDPSATQTGYRDAPRSILVARGTPFVRHVGPSDRTEAGD